MLKMLCMDWRVDKDTGRTRTLKGTRMLGGIRTLGEQGR